MQVTLEVRARFEMEMAKRTIEKLPIRETEKAVVVAQIEAEIAKVKADEVVKDAISERK